MFRYISYIFFDIQCSSLGFKLKYFFEKIIKFPIVLVNRYFSMSIEVPYLFKEDFIINNSDWKFLIKAKSGNDYAISTHQEYKLRPFFLDISDGYFIDIGSHVWKWSIVLWNKIKDIKILAFEPNPETFYYLNKNIELNWLSNTISAFNLWVWDENSILSFEKNIESSMSKFVETKTEETIDIEVVKMDDFLNEMKIAISEIKLIKIDTEGFEFKVLQWMEGLLKDTNFKSKIICEILPEQEDKDLIIDFLAKYNFGYKVLPTKTDYLFSKNHS